MKKWILLFLLLPNLAWGATWYVRPISGEYGGEDGTAYATAYDGFVGITWGVGGVVAGDTLYVCGTHTEQLTVGASGSNGSLITIRGDYGGDPCVIDGATIGIKVDQNYVTLLNLTVTDSTDGTFGNIAIEGNNVTVQGCTSSGATNHGIVFYNESGDNLVTGCVINGNGDSGIFGFQEVATHGHENIIRNNCIYQNHIFGICLYSNYYIIENNLVYNNGNTGDVTSGIEIADWGGGYGQHNIIRYNTVWGQISGGDDGEGIYADDVSAYVDIYYNVVYGNDGPGIGVHRSDYINVYNNTVYGNCLNSSGELTNKTEIKVIDTSIGESSYVVIKNNAVQATQANTYAIWLNATTYGMTGLDITNNDWYASATNWYFWNATGGNNLTTWNALTGVGTDLNSDPLFVSATDFHLLAGSPAQNAGTIISSIPQRDKDGIPIVDLPDIGAYEYFGVHAGPGTYVIGGSVK